MTVVKFEQPDKVDVVKGNTSTSTVYIISKADFTNFDEVWVHDDEAESSITECLATVLLSFAVIKSQQQGLFVRGKNLSLALLDDDLTHDVMTAAAEVLREDRRNR